MPSDRRWSDADRELVAQAIRDNNAPEAWFENPQLVPVHHFAAAALDALAAAGKLLPEPNHTHTEWGVWWHAGNPDGICLGESRLTSEETAHQEGQRRIGEYLIDSYTVVRREHRLYPDGDWSGHWQRHSGPHGRENEVA